MHGGKRHWLSKHVWLYILLFETEIIKRLKVAGKSQCLQYHADKGVIFFWGSLSDGASLRAEFQSQGKNRGPTMLE